MPTSPPYDLITFSGGSTRGVAMAYAAVWAQDQGIYPEAYAGISAGSLVAISAACAKQKECLAAFLNLKSSDIFSAWPINSRGNLNIWQLMRALWITRGKALADMGSLRTTIRRIISESDYNQWRLYSTTKVYVQASTLESDEKKIFELSQVDYPTAIEILMASCAFPVVASPVHIFGTPYMDGGLVDNIIRPAGFVNSLNFTAYRSPTPWKNTTNLLNIILSALEIMLYWNAADDAEILTQKSGTHQVIRIPSFGSEFEFNPDTIRKNYLAAKNTLK